MTHYMPISHVVKVTRYPLHLLATPRCDSVIQHKYMRLAIIELVLSMNFLRSLAD